MPSDDLLLAVHPDGAVAAIYDDQLLPVLAELGRTTIRRASHVEPVAIDGFTVGGLFLAAVVAVAQLRRAHEKLTPPIGCQHAEIGAAMESFQRTWYRLRDGWGLVWAWRIREMVQSAARHAKLPGEMLWSGLCMESGEAATTTEPPTIAQAPDLPTRTRPGNAERLFAVREWCRLLQTVARRFAPPD